jgi:hypothetical protein
VASRRTTLDEEALGESLLGELDELATEAFGEDAEVTLFSSGSAEDLRYGYELTVDDEIVRVDGGYDSLLAMLSSLEEWCEERTESHRGAPEPGDDED